MMKSGKYYVIQMQDKKINSLQCIPAIQLLLRYVAYLPLWSGLLLGDLERHGNGSEVTPSSVHTTKTVAEIWMKIEKKVYAGRQEAVKTSRVHNPNKQK